MPISFRRSGEEWQEYSMQTMVISLDGTEGADSKCLAYLSLVP